MNFEEFVKRYKEVIEKHGFEIEISDGEFVKMYISHIVMRNWDVEEIEKFNKSAKEKIAKRYL